MNHLIIANWKMHLTLEESIRFCTSLTGKNYNNHLIISPPAPYLAYLANSFPSISFCAQNISHIENTGPYTGEYSGFILKSCNINYALIGHSERRNLFGESNEVIRQKAQNCLNAGISPIICIGEPLNVRENGNYKDFILKQLVESVPHTPVPIIIAYEPIWSIGTGLIPSESQLIEVCEIVGSFLRESQVANNMRLVYGGSVNLDNIKNIVNLKNISGVLIGSASLKYEVLIQMLT